MRVVYVWLMDVLLSYCVQIPIGLTLWLLSGVVVPQLTRAYWWVVVLRRRIKGVALDQPYDYMMGGRPK